MRVSGIEVVAPVTEEFPKSSNGTIRYRQDYTEIRQFFTLELL